MKHAHPFTLDEQRAARLAESYPLVGHAAERDHTAFLLVEEAITDGTLRGGGPCSLATDRLADSEGELDGYIILLHIADGYWVRSPIKRASYFSGPAAILHDAADEANAMTRLARTMHKPRQPWHCIRDIRPGWRRRGSRRTLKATRARNAGCTTRVS
jgi:hypothetical protein